MDEDVRPAARLLRDLASGGRVLVCDGAMGTMLHSTGVPLDRSLSELNLARPHLVRDLHAAYLAAGADIVQTNTFDANRLRLARAGLQDGVAEINVAGARLAREAVRESGSAALVAGSVGPVISAAAPRLPFRDREPILREQIAALASWVDLIMLETFGDLESLEQAATVALAECDLPVVAQLTFGDDGRTLRGEEPREAAAALAALKVTAIGANCTVGPAVLHDVVAELAAGCALPISVQPNAGVPRRLGRQLRYARNTEYFAEAAGQFVASGATLVGGCCGTTPAHIRAVARSVRPLRPGRPKAALRLAGHAWPFASCPSSQTPSQPTGRTRAASSWWPECEPRKDRTWPSSPLTRPSLSGPAPACWQSPTTRHPQPASALSPPLPYWGNAPEPASSSPWKQQAGAWQRSRPTCSAATRSESRRWYAEAALRGWPETTRNRSPPATSTRSGLSPR